MKRALAALVAAFVLGLVAVASAALADVTDDPPQTCTATSCSASRVHASPRQWSDRQWVVVAAVWRDHGRYPHQAVWLQRRSTGGPWVTVDRAVSGERGTALFVVDSPSGRPDSSSWRIRYPGDETTLYDDSAAFSIPAN